MSLTIERGCNLTESQAFKQRSVSCRPRHSHCKSLSLCLLCAFGTRCHVLPRPSRFCCPVLQIYEAHLAEVKRVVPPGQLLIFNPKDGWGPLCAFLGKEPPADGAPYPYVNETPEFKERMKGLEKLAGAMEKATWVQWGLVAAAGVAVAVVMRARAGAGAK